MKKINKNAFLPLDKEEARIMKDIEDNKYVSVTEKELEETKTMFSNAKWVNNELDKTKPITTRIRVRDLIALKIKAKKQGVKYQSLLSTIVHNYVKDESTEKYAVSREKN